MDSKVRNVRLKDVGGRAACWLSSSKSTCGCSIAVALCCLLALYSPRMSSAQSHSGEDTAPMLFSVFPTGGGQGTTVHAELRGLRLDGAYAVWFDSGGLKGRLIKTERLNEEFKPKVSQREKKPEPQTIDSAEVEIQIDRTVSPEGIHFGSFLLMASLIRSAFR